MIKQILFFLLLVGAMDSCKNIDAATSKMDTALSLAGENKAELQKVLTHYKEAGDTLKLAAAHFLIVNMPGKKHIKYAPYDSLGNIVPYNLFDYDNNDAIHAAKEKLQDSLKCRFLYMPSSKVEDIASITADYLIENIDYAFKAWQMPWAKHLSFAEFCEYLLPYRFGNEPIENWRKQLFLQMHWVLDSAKKDASVIRLCQIVNDSIKKVFAYKHYELDFYPGALSYSQAKKIKGGLCDDLNMIGAYWMRAIGIPVAPEFTPNWANSNFGGHAWLSVLTENKKTVPFNPAYDNPFLDSLPFKESRICKAYRKQFTNKPIVFTQLHNDLKSPPKYLLEDNFIDVTQQLTKVTGCSIPLRNGITLPSKFAYIGVLSGYGWKAVDTVVVNKTIMAKNIGLHTIYNVFAISNDSAKTCSYVSNPFLVNESGKIVTLVPDQQAFDDFSINFKKDYWWLRKERQYTLTVWKNNQWEKIGAPLKWNGKKWASPANNDPLIVSKNDSIITFNKIAKNSLLRLQNIEPIDDIGSYGRPFLISNGKAVTY